MDYNFREIEPKWQKRWVENGTYRVAGLHVGHPLGYIASDIYARFKRQQGYNVLNPMGYDAYGLPAEQYAIQTGQHPEKTTFENINRYRNQLDLRPHLLQMDTVGLPAHVQELFQPLVAQGSAHHQAH